MKFNVFWPLLVSLAVGIAALGYFTAKDLFAPQRAVWDAITITEQRADGLTVAAEVQRRESSRCTNGVQADLRHEGAVTRLEPPVRTIANGLSIYSVRTGPLAPGSYQFQLREVFNCSSIGPEIIDAPWQTFEVSE